MILVKLEHGKVRIVFACISQACIKYWQLRTHSTLALVQLIALWGVVSVYVTAVVCVFSGWLFWGWWYIRNICALFNYWLGIPRETMYAYIYTYMTIWHIHIHALDTYIYIYICISIYIHWYFYLQRERGGERQRDCSCPLIWPVCFWWGDYCQFDSAHMGIERHKTSQSYMDPSWFIYLFEFVSYLHREMD